MPTGSGMWTYPPIISGSAWNALLGQGIINCGVTFPSTKIEGQMYYRKDQEQLYIYSGSTWVYVPKWSTVPNTIVTGSLTAGKNIIQLTSGSDMSASDILDCLWHYDGSGSNATWDASSYIMPSGSKGVLQWKDDVGYGANDYMDLFMIRSDSEPTNPILYASQHIIVKKDITVGGFLGSNQGALYLGSGLTAIDDQPQIIAMHADTGDDTPYGPLRKDVIEMNTLDGDSGSASVLANCYSGSSIVISGTNIVTSSRGLQNVTADASIINAGTFNLARIPTMDDAHIPDLETLSYGGTFALAQIPTMDDAHIPDLETLSYGAAFNIAQIPTITHTKTDFANQDLLTGSSVTFVSAKGSVQTRGLSFVWKDASATAVTRSNQSSNITWSDVDLTALTSSDAKMAYLQINMHVDSVGATGSGVALRKNGTTPTDYPALIIDNSVPVGLEQSGCYIVGLDSGQVFEYSFIADGFQIDIEINVLGYWE